MVLNRISIFHFQKVVKRLLERSQSLVPKLNFNVVDVRDVAAAHLKAMTLDDASGM